ncbi:MAG: TonB-dependent receptor [Desulfobacula sp.]|uniref:TonB-dependent receptor plug domain-containing protein n=1 Tax=Desulfobacula sp. TaxID=2593537 RepID=UPI0025BBB463|nr:TonB-dependent receptor [Desulfobacula sp.]MCD4718639.1 TonB-dependent receptor [Desulfobacula sp.]
MTKRVLFYLTFLWVIPVSLVLAQESRTSQVFDLGQVLVIGDGEKTDKMTTIDVVSIEDIKMQGAKTVAQALEFIPGVDIRTGKKGQASLKLRGFDQSDVKVLIDGVPAHESYEGSLDLDQISIDSIAMIKVIKGASSVLYGPNTMGGVINIITKKGGEKPYTSISTSFGQNNTQNYVFNHGSSSGQFNYWITGSHRTTDGFELADDFDPNNPRTGLGTDFNEDGGIRDLSYFTKNTFNAKIGYEVDDNSKLYLSFDYHDNEKGCPTEDSRYWEFDEWNQWHVNLVGEHDFTDILTMKARVYYVDHTDILKDVSWDADHTTSRKFFQESSYDDYTLGSEVQAYLDFGNLSLVKMGVSYMKDNHTQQDYFDAATWDVIRGRAVAGIQPKEEYEVDIYSYGIEDEIRLFDRLTVNGGVSFDVHDPVKAYGGIDRDKTEVWNPQAGIAFDVTNDFNLYASVGKKTRFPQMKELYSNLGGGNKSLKPQKTIAYEIGAYKKFSDVLNLSMAAFLNDVEDRIIRERVAGVKQCVNKGETEIKGFETRVNITTPWNLDLGLGYTYLCAEEKDDAASAARDCEYMPEHKATLDVRYAFDFGLSTSFQTVYTGEQIEYDDSDNKVQIDDFIVCNLKLNQQISFTKKLTTDFFIEFKNIFDEDYEEGSGPMPGRSFLIGMTLSF